VHVDIGEINNHLRAAGTRSPEWIRQALALNQRLERVSSTTAFAAGVSPNSATYPVPEGVNSRLPNGTNY
jgi:hypothetical protein